MGIFDTDPFTTDNVVNFIAYLRHKRLSPATVATYLSAISYLCKIKVITDPTDNFIVKTVMNSYRKLTPPGVTRLPITLPILHKMICALPHVITKTRTQILYTSMYLLAFYALLRLGEITTGSNYNSANILGVHQIEISDTQLTLSFFHYKHSDGTAHKLIIKHCADTSVCPVWNMRRYLQIRGKANGPLFTHDGLAPIDRCEFVDLIKLTLSFIGLEYGRYTSHSFRIGAACWLADQNVSDTSIRHAGRWRSSAFLKYIKHYHPTIRS